MSGGGPRERKQAYLTKIDGLVQEYQKVMIVLADNVGSNQMQKIRIALRNKAIILMGKNTLVRKAIRGKVQSNADLENLIPHVKGNVGFVFTNGNLSEVKKIIEANKVDAAAKAGIIAPCDVIVPANPQTNLEPTKTAFFQALNIATKITKGQIEILQDVPLIKEGDKVGTSEATLLQMLGIKPFQYGLKILQIYDNGSIYSPKVLDITEDEILGKFREGISRIASVSLQIGYPTLASLPHSLLNGYKRILAVSLATEYTFPASQKVKDYLKNPGAFATTGPVETKKEEKGGKKEEKGGKKEEKKEEKKPEPEPEPDDDGEMGLSLFD